MHMVAWAWCSDSVHECRARLLSELGTLQKHEVDNLAHMAQPREAGWLCEWASYSAGSAQESQQQRLHIFNDWRSTTTSSKHKALEAGAVNQTHGDAQQQQKAVEASAGLAPTGAQGGEIPT